uniref:Uncharacterized protein n=1 Tax=Ananas comosus var. bracteatus TaxID=296719 RepID=A0A6V7PW86_ANACO|nr:unnamed protein product [Ananas comosus var. bracteatus]
MENRPTAYQRPSSGASLRWGILRRSLLPRSSSRSDHGLQESTDNISRKAVSGFNLIYWRALDDHFPETLGYPLKGKDALKPRDICILYKLPVGNIPEISLIQRRGNCIELNDFEVSTRHDVDTTGLVSLQQWKYHSWPTCCFSAPTPAMKEEGDGKEGKRRGGD